MMDPDPEEGEVEGGLGGGKWGEGGGLGKKWGRARMTARRREASLNPPPKSCCLFFLSLSIGPN